MATNGYESVPYDKLIAGMVEDFVTQSIIIEAADDAVYERGAVMARTGFAADGMWICTIVDSASAVEGANLPKGVLVDDEVDATTGNQRATIYTSGEFNRAALKFGGTDTIATHEAALNDAKLYTKRVVG